MAISNANRRELDNMCPAAREAALGSSVQTAQADVASLQTNVGVLQVQVSELEGNVGDPVADIAALKAIVAADREDKQIRAVEDISAVYIFDAEDTDAGDDDLIVTPDDVVEPAPGRWRKTGGAGAAGDISYDNSASGLVADNVQDAIDEVYDALPAEIPIYNPNPGYRGIVVHVIVAAAFNPAPGGDPPLITITAFDVIKSIHGVPVEPITYYLRKEAGAYGPGNVNPKAEMLTFECDSVGMSEQCYVKLVDSTDPVPVEWCEVPFAVQVEDGSGDCELCFD